MFDNRDLNIAKSKRMEQYIREICEIFTHFVEEHFVPHFQSNWRETWRHIGTRTESPISLETPPPYRIQASFVSLLKLCLKKKR